MKRYIPKIIFNKVLHFNSSSVIIGVMIEDYQSVSGQFAHSFLLYKKG